MSSLPNKVPYEVEVRAIDIKEFAYLVELGGRSVKGEFGLGAASAAKLIYDIAENLWDSSDLEQRLDDINTIIGLANFIDRAGTEDEGKFGFSAARAAIRIREIAQTMIEPTGGIEHDN